MECPNCGLENRAIARFCQRCGTRLQSPAAAEPEAAGDQATVHDEVAIEQAVATEPAATAEQPATVDEIVATEQIGAPEKVTAPEQPAPAEQAASEEEAQAPEQVIATEQAAAEEQAVASGQAAAEKQAAAEGQVPAQEQAVAEEQATAGEHVPGEGTGPGEVVAAQTTAEDTLSASDEAIELLARAEWVEPPGEQPGVAALPEARLVTPATGEAGDESTRPAEHMPVEDSGGTEQMPEPISTQQPQGAGGPVGADVPGDAVHDEAGAGGHPVPAGSSPQEPPSGPAAAAEAELREADVLPWRDEPRSPPVLEPGEVIDGRYRIVELLAVDEAGVLYSARDLQRCPQCGFAGNSPDQAFCAACGAVLDQKPLVRVLQHPVDEDPPPDVEVLDHIVAGQRAYWVWKEPGKQTDVLGGSEEPMRLVIGQRTHPGQTRELDEDSLFTLALTRTYESIEYATALFVVADGMGGHEAGEVASRIAIRALAEAVLRDVLARELAGAELDDDAVRGALERAVQAANEQVFLERERRENDMGTTVTATLLRQWTLYVAHVGDCRAYRWGSDGLQQLTTDHSVIASMVASGAAQPDEVYTHPHRSVIYRSVGDQPSVEVDTAVLSVDPGDRLVLCCDGLWETLRDDGIEDVLLREADPQRACDAMVEQANEAGGPDNISVIVVQL